MSNRLILVTGAAGRLGSVVCQTLIEARKEIRATDKVRATLPTALFRQTHLLHPCDSHRLLEGVGTLIHLANNPEPLADSRTSFDENVCMNRLIFQAACEAGVREIIFASSLFVYSRCPNPNRSLKLLPYLPLDVNSPAEPDTFYGLGKLCSEQLLAQLSRQYGTAGVVLRLPFLTYGPPPADSREALLKGRFRFIFDYLTYRDAASLILKIIDCDLPGFRIYLPSSRHNSLHRSASDLIKEYFPGVPLRKPAAELDSLIDYSVITRETDWEPLDQSLPKPPPVKPSVWIHIKRLLKHSLT